MDPALAAAIALHRQGRLDQAEKAYDALLSAQPDLAEAHNALGILRLQTGKPEAALAAFDTALSLQPAYVGAWGNRGAALKAMNRPTQALEAMEHALVLAPDSAETHYNLGCLHHEAGRLDQAMAFYGKATDLNPGHVGAWNNLGKVFHDLSRLDESITAFTRALEQAPDNAMIRYGLSLSQLRAGLWDAGWSNHESRFAAKITPLRHQHIPSWNGEPTKGMRILLWSEQGLGDTLQFCRFALMLAQQGARVFLEVPAPLYRLLAGLSGLTVLRIGDPIPEVDSQCPLLSLPLHLERRPISLGAILAPVVSENASRTSDSTSLSVGVVWAGNPAQPNNANRSLPASLLAPLSRIPDVRLQSLQMGEAAPPFMTPLPETISDMLDTARLMAGLDLVISVDSAPLHLSGSLGLPTWGLLSLSCDWRYGTSGDATGWYPGMRLYRQTTYRGWPGVIDRVATDLSALAFEKFRQGGQPS